jgi:hypothetical protein
MHHECGTGREQRQYRSTIKFPEPGAQKVSENLEVLVAYREQRWDDALGALNASLEAMPRDRPSMTLRKRVESLKTNPPLQNWDDSSHIEK